MHRNCALPGVLLFSLSSALFAGTGLIDTVAVTGMGAVTPPAISSSPGGMALDPSGAVLVADNNNHRVVRIDPASGALTTVAGTGVSGFSGDGGPATQAQLSGPVGVAVDSAGNILIADTRNNRVRRVDAQTGIITTIAGTGAAASTGDYGPASAAAINGPVGLAFDSAGNLFVADGHGNFVRRIDAISGTITSVAGNGVQSFTPDGALAANSSLNFPAFLAFDRNGNLLVSEIGTQRVRRIDPSGVLSTVAGNGTSTYATDGGPATNAAIGMPGQLAFDAAGNLYIPSINLGRVFRIDAATGILYTVAGNGNTSMGATGGDGGLATSAVIPQPISTLSMPNGDLMVVDGWAFSVRRVSLPSPYVYTAVSIFESVLGREVTARVIPMNGTGVPTGAIQFSNGYGAILATVWLSNGTATYMESGTSVVMATYLGDGAYSTSTSPVLALPPRISTSVALASSTNPSQTQQPVTFTATITTGGGSSYLPTGTVQLLDGNTVIASTTTLNGTAQFTVSFTSAGAHSISAVYQGDGTYAAGVSQLVNQTVYTPPLAVALASSAPGSTYGQAVQFTATLSQTDATGTVQFLDGGAPLGSAPVLGGAAVLSVGWLNAGAHSITASYGGDANHSPATSAPLVETVAQATPTFTLASSLNPSIVGQTVAFSATMSPVSTGASFSIQVSNPPPSMQGTWSTTGQTSATTSTLAAGAHTVTAVWAGDANVAAGTSAPITQIVKSQASGAVTSSANPSTAGSAVTFTATVSPATATGSVEFRDYGTAGAYTTLGSATLAGGTASFTTSTLTIGAHSVAVYYAGDASIAGFTSPTVAQTVNAIATTVTLVSAENPTYPQHPVSYSVTVTPTGNPTAQPTGTVQVLDGTALLATVTLQNGAAAFPLSLSFGTHSLTAVYSGDAVFAGGTSSALSEVVKNAAGGSVSSSGFLPVGQAVTFTATILPQDATGTVEFRDYGSSGSTFAVLATVALSNGTASFTTSSLAVGTHNIVAHYSGDASYLGFDTTPLGQVVTKLGATLLPSSSENPTVLDRAVAITVTVTPSMPFATAATGTVQLLDGGATIATATLDNGSAQFSVAFGTTGPHLLTVSYSGDANYLANTSGTLTETVNKIATATALASSANPSTAGQTVTLTATVSPAAATGTVQFLDGATPLGTVPLTGGTASLATALPAGSHSLTALYSGDSTHSTSSSAALAQTVNKIATTVAVTSSVNPSTFGQPVTLTATVSPAAATGTVQFLDGAAPLGTATITGGVASLAVSLSAGSHSITASYAGDATYANSSSAALSQTVNKAASAVGIVSSANPSIFGRAVTFTATISPATATGTIQFLDADIPLGSVTVSGGVAVLSTAALGAGTHALSAIYSGDSSYLGSFSATLPQTVNKAATAVSLSSSANPANSGQPVTFTAVVAPASATGAVQFLDGATVLGTAPVSAGVAALTTASLAAGTHSISAGYSGDANYAGVSASLSQSVKPATTTTLTSTAASITYGQSITFTATISPSAATGSVQFLDGGVSLGVVPVSSGRAKLSLATLTAGTHSVTAVYSGDTAYSPSASSARVVTVAQAKPSITLSASPNPATAGQTVTFTANVPTSATGTVEFDDGSVVLATAPVQNGVATIATATLASGTHQVTATYNGDTNFTTATSGKLNLKVN